MEPLKWTTQRRKVNDLITYEHNPRQLTKEQAKKLTESLSKFDLAEIPVIDTDNKIVAGNQRMFVMKLLGRGEEEIDVRVPNRKLTEEEFKEYNIGSNLWTAGWDWEILANEFDFGQLVDFGFEPREIEKLFDIVKEDEFDVGDELKKIVAPAVTYGDHWRLGRNRLVCGDATKEDDLANLMVAERARLIFTDPPYSVDYKSVAGLSYDSKKYGDSGKIFNDDKTPEEALEFYIKVLKNLFQYSTDDCTIYWWFANANNYINREAFKAAGWKMSQIIIWLKNSMVFSHGQDYHRCYEPCMLGWKEKKVHYKNKKIGNFKDVFSLEISDFSELLDVWYEHRDQTSKYIHPTQKPVRLAERAIKKNSEQNDLVVDVFGGSGSTLMACEQMNRRCNIMELDPKFAHAILNRWSKFTGDDPIRQSDNKKWSEVSNEKT